MKSIIGFDQHSRGHSHTLGLLTAFMHSLEKQGLFAIKVALALALVVVVTLTAIAAEQYFSAARPLADADLISMLQ